MVLKVLDTAHFITKLLEYLICGSTKNRVSIKQIGHVSFPFRLPFLGASLSASTLIHEVEAKLIPSVET